MSLTFISCKNDEIPQVHVDAQKGVAVMVTNPAGDRWSESDDFLPLPGNMAKVGKYDVFIISDRMKKGSNQDVTIIGAVEYTEGTDKKFMIVAIPTKESSRSISVDDFDEFSTVYSSVRWIIEQYLLNVKGANAIKIKNWHNELYAINLLNHSDIQKS